MKPLTLWIYSDTPHSPSFEIHLAKDEAEALAKAKALMLGNPGYQRIEIFDGEAYLATTHALSRAIQVSRKVGETRAA